jgi:hypothetical protein
MIYCSVTNINNINNVNNINIYYLPRKLLVIYISRKKKKKKKIFSVLQHKRNLSKFIHLY